MFDVEPKRPKKKRPSSDREIWATQRTRTGPIQWRQVTVAADCSAPFRSRQQITLTESCRDTIWHRCQWNIHDGSRTMELTALLLFTTRFQMAKTNGRVSIRLSACYDSRPTTTRVAIFEHRIEATGWKKMSHMARQLLHRPDFSNILFHRAI